MVKSQLHKLIKNRIPQKDIAIRFFTYLYMRNLSAKVALLRDTAGQYLEMFEKLYDDFSVISVSINKKGKHDWYRVSWTESATTYFQNFYFDVSLVDKLYGK